MEFHMALVRAISPFHGALLELGIKAQRGTGGVFE
jgi:hypothetical protein